MDIFIVNFLYALNIKNMGKPNDIFGTFVRKPLGALDEKTPVPIGWFALPFNLMKTKEDRRKNHGKWFTIESKNKKIYRVLRFAPHLHGTVNNKEQKDIVLDWVGWIDLCGRDEEVDISLDLKISKTRIWEVLFAGLMHPEPSYRLSTLLALLSVILGLLSLFLAIFLSQPSSPLTCIH